MMGPRREQSKATTNEHEFRTSCEDLVSIQTSPVWLRASIRWIGFSEHDANHQKPRSGSDLIATRFWLPTRSEIAFHPITHCCKRWIGLSEDDAKPGATGASFTNALGDRVPPCHLAHC